MWLKKQKNSSESGQVQELDWKGVRWQPMSKENQKKLYAQFAVVAKYIAQKDLKMH